MKCECTKNCTCEVEQQKSVERNGKHYCAEAGVVGNCSTYKFGLRIVLGGGAAHRSLAAVWTLLSSGRLRGKDDQLEWFPARKRRAKKA